MHNENNKIMLNDSGKNNKIPANMSSNIGNIISLISILSLIGIIIAGMLIAIFFLRDDEYVKAILVWIATLLVAAIISSFISGFASIIIDCHVIRSLIELKYLENSNETFGKEKTIYENFESSEKTNSDNDFQKNEQVKTKIENLRNEAPHIVCDIEDNENCDKGNNTNDDNVDNFEKYEEDRESGNLHYEKPLKEYKVGDEFSFGKYIQNNDGHSIKENINWIILDKKCGKALLISKYAIECMPLNLESENTTWKTCTLRNWLNNEFINTAFTSDERSHIAKVRLNCCKDTVYDGNEEENIYEEAFILSVSEAKKYFEGNDLITCQPTKYAVNKNIYVAGNGNCWWWLRSSGKYPDRFTNVDSDGTISELGLDVSETRSGVRPALWVEM